MTWYDNIGKLGEMNETIRILLHTLLVVLICVKVWRMIEPKTQAARILRAGVLVVSLLGVLAVLRVIEG